MPTVTDAQNEANTLSALISSLSGASDPASIRSQIQTTALTLQSMLLSLTNAAADAAAAATGISFDSLITWGASADGNLRNKVINAATSYQPIATLLQQVVGWSIVLGTVGWKATPETAGAGALITLLATYRTVTGT